MNYIQKQAALQKLAQVRLAINYVMRDRGMKKQALGFGRAIEDIRKEIANPSYGLPQKEPTLAPAPANRRYKPVPQQPYTGDPQIKSLRNPYYNPDTGKIGPPFRPLPQNPIYQQYLEAIKRP